jgi:hypothetical protein
MSFDDAASSDGARPIVFIAAMSSECASLRHRAAAGAAWRVEQCGPGSERAQAAAARVLASGAELCVSWGLAGALDATVAPGALLAPRRILSTSAPALAVDERRHAALAVLADEFELLTGDLLTVPTVLESPDAKRAAALASRAIAVDMESAAIAGAAARAGVPFVALRVIVDALDDALPSDAEQWVDERGQRRMAPALRAVVAVRQWRPLLKLAHRYRVASRVLTRLATALHERGLLDGRTPSLHVRS